MDPRSALDECTATPRCRARSHVTTCPMSSGPGAPAVDVDPASPPPGSGSTVGDRTTPGPEPRDVSALQRWDAAVVERDLYRKGLASASRLLDLRLGQLAEARADIIELRQRITDLEAGRP